MIFEPQVTGVLESGHLLRQEHPTPLMFSSPRAPPQLRLLYCYPGPWRLFLIGEDTGTRELLGSWESSPPNQEVEQAVFAKKGRPSAAERVRASSKMFQDGM